MLQKGWVCLRWLLLGSLLVVAPAAAETGAWYEALSVVVLAPVEGRAVVQEAAGELHLLAVGDAVPGAEATIVHILPDRLVVEEPVPGSRTAKRRLWLYRGRGTDGRPRFQILDPVRPPLPPLDKPLALEPDLPQVPAPAPEDSRSEENHGR